MTNPRKKGYLLPDEPGDPRSTTSSGDGGPTPMTHSSSQHPSGDIGPGGQGAPEFGRLQSRVSEALRDPPDGRYAFVTFKLSDGEVTLDGWVAHADLRDELMRTIRAIPGVTDVVCNIGIGG
ncbi:BON domain-containing protein [Pandoraea nosoerga]|uniref:BON domain-containing protein n=1 Tax=Pandoraea nosoerga TaxID=2508296 RepID=A0A5E4UED2_9BURK|nr:MULTISPECIES: BON domain-containing protein [Pandoraea]MBN4667156.1 BON domain-containing protein [Pandoraea nosoerga]MBN4677144.1 BON domain-containing protein [Pandoraea nosoerga]MBN4681819.1 BON domain-containing protein [Pandoraea nosoerga]MBN4746261.1 BON domain-containing protein [Pandoraea nosoerga]VVD98347.1 hypothetical protein PNO31109_01981 [Pandoraea nosoerga]